MEAEKKKSSLNIPAFWKAQDKDWRVTVIRTSMERFGYKMVLPYLTLYVILLGATKTQYGYVTSLGLITGGLLAPVIGSLIDKNGPKKVYMFGIAVLAGGYLALASANVWQVAALGIFLHSMGGRMSIQGCSTICGNCLANCDRAKGMLICESLAAGVLGMLGPMLSGWLMVNVMGVHGKPTDPNSIRPLFWIVFVITLLSMLLIAFKLSFKSWGTNHSGKVKTNVFRDGMAILKADKNCRKWVIISAVGGMPMTFILPYVQLYASEAKQASAATLAAMVTATALTSVLLGYVTGILGDKHGRKPVLFATTGLYIVAMLLLIFAKSPKMLIIVGMLQGFQEIGGSVAGSVSHELVPARLMGRWIGAVGMFTSIFGAIMAAFSGIIYDNLGGKYLFIIYVICELAIRLPLLASIPETLTHPVDETKFAHIS
jgi:MFS family permease